MILRVINIYWYVVPLVAAVSLVYAASRHESWLSRHAPVALRCASAWATETDSPRLKARRRRDMGSGRWSAAP